jgi:hypothetical protein
MAPTRPTGANELPPAPFPVDSSHKVTINGKVYDAFLHPGVVASEQPDACVTMAQYLRDVETAYAAAGKPDGGPLGSAYSNIVHSRVTKVLNGDHSKTNLAAIAEVYVRIVKPLNSVGSLPGSGTVENLAGDAAGILKFLSDPVRLGELIVGVVLLGVAFNAVLRSSMGSSAPQIKSSSAIPASKIAKAFRD